MFLGPLAFNIILCGIHFLVPSLFYVVQHPKGLLFKKAHFFNFFCPFSFAFSFWRYSFLVWGPEFYFHSKIRRYQMSIEMILYGTFRSIACANIALIFDRWRNAHQPCCVLLRRLTSLCFWLVYDTWGPVNILFPLFQLFWTHNSDWNLVEHALSC